MGYLLVPCDEEGRVNQEDLGPELCALTPWAAVSHLARISGWSRGAGHRLASWDGGSWSLAAIPQMPDMEGLLSHAAARPPFSENVGSWNAKIVGYREVLRQRVQEPTLHAGVCRLWPQGTDLVTLCQAAAAEVWLAVQRRCISEPHASLVRAGRIEAGRALVIQGVYDNLWSLGFPHMAEVQRGPVQLDGVPSCALAGLVPLGVLDQAMPAVVFYDARQPWR